MAVAEVAPKAKPLMRPSPGNCSAAVIAPTALTAPAMQARMRSRTGRITASPWLSDKTAKRVRSRCMR